MRASNCCVAVFLLAMAGCPRDIFCSDSSVGRDLLTVVAKYAYFVLPSEGPWFQTPPFRDASLSNFGRVATVYGPAGTVSVSAAGASSAENSLEIGAVSATWSNACDLLAVVTRGAAGDRVVIMTDELKTEVEIPVNLPAADDGSPYKRFVISWSADDRLVAVSTDAIRNDNPSPSWPDNLRAVPLCLFIDWRAGGIRSTHELHNVYFIGSDTVVGTPPTDSVTETAEAMFNVHRFALSGDQLQDQGLVHGAGFAVGSHPSSGVFVTVDEVAPLVEFNPRYVRDRVTDGGCRVVRSANAEDKILVAERAPIADLIPEGF